MMTPSALGTLDAASPPAPRPRDWAALAVLTLAVTLLGVDTTVLSLAIPSLSTHLAPSASQLLWIGDIYSFTLAGLLVTMGNVADRIGRRRLLLIGTAGFGMSSVLAAFAPSATALIIARALLGLSGATIMPSTLSLVRNIFPDARHRDTAIAIWSAGASGGTALGPLVGGFLLGHFWWGSVFLINVPVMILIVVTGAWLLPESRNDRGAPIDFLSAVLSVGAIIPLIYAVKTFAHDGFTVLGLVGLAVGLALGWVFVSRQRVLSTPLIDVGLFARPAFAWAVLTSVMAIFALAGLWYFFSQYLQLVREYSALRAGLAELPNPIAAVAVVVLVGRLVSRFGRGRACAGGLVVMALGLLTLVAAGFFPGYPPLAIALILIGAGIGIASAVATAAVLDAVPAGRAGAASAISETGFELGAALGIAVLGSVQDVGYRAHLGGLDDDAASALPGSVIEAARQSLATLAGVVDRGDAAQAAFYGRAQQAFAQAMQTTAVIAALILLLAAVMAWRHVPAGGEDSADPNEER